MSRVDWAVARYNWYRASGLLDDSSQRNAEIGTQHCPPDPPPPKPHLKWYPLSKPDDDAATTYRPPIGTTPQQRYSRQASINADAGTSPLRRQTISTAGHAANGLSHDPRTWSRVDWAVARYNWYRACGLLDDSPQRPAEIARYHRSPDPPRPKPHLKWYPLTKPDDEVATPYQRSGPATPSAPSRRHYDQRVENAHVRSILARYQAEKVEAAKGLVSSHHFDPSQHPRAAAGQPTGGQFVRSGERDFAAVFESPATSPTESLEDQLPALTEYPQILLADANSASLATQFAIASLAQIPHKHHIFAREFGELITDLFRQVDSSFNIDHYTTTVDKLVAHGPTPKDIKDQLHNLNQMASKGGSWNSHLQLLFGTAEFQKMNPQQQRKAILERILSLANTNEFDLTDLTKWGSSKLEDNAKCVARFLNLCAEAGVNEKEYGKQLGKLVARSLETEVGRQMLKEIAPEIAERFVKGGIKGMLKNGPKTVLKKAFGPLSAFMIAMAMQNGEVEAAVCDAANIPPEALDQLKGLMRGDASFDLATLGMPSVDSAGILRVGKRAECSVNGKAVGFVNVHKILDAGDGTFLVTVSGEKDRFIQLRVDPATHNYAPLPADFRYFSYGLLPELQVPDPVIK